MDQTQDAPPKALRALTPKQWVLGYLAAAWVLIQVLDVLRESWNLGQALVQAIQIGLVLGFFVVAGLAALAGRRRQHKPSTPTRGHPVLSAGGWVIAALLIVSLGFTALSSNRTTWARNEAIPEGRRLVEEGEYVAALALAEEAERHLDDDPALAELFDASSTVLSIATEPTEADVYVKEYAAPDSEWRHLGQSPLVDVRLALGDKQWRIEKAGFETARRTPSGLDDLSLDLAPEGSTPDGMVRVPARTTPGWTAETGPNLILPLPTFFYDRYEVTNREYLAFVESGAYADPSIWRDLAELGLPPGGEAAFVDATGRPGPANWELGAPHPGTEDLPVWGVSWFEAVAFCASVDKTLPTLYHWSGSSGVFMTAASVAATSNFESEGARPGSESASVGAYGAFDLAGNVREWIWNEAADGRLILGGAWNDPEYFISHAQTFDPMDRSEGNGFRCIRDAGTTERYALAREPVTLNIRDYYAEVPVSDEIFEIFKRQFAYDETDLETRIEESGITAEGARYDVVSYTSPYEGSRGGALVILPPGEGPHQAVVVYPGSGAPLRASVTSELDSFEGWSFLLRTGRAVVVPILKGTFSRQDGLESTWPSETRRYAEYAVHWVQDVSRAVDYVETRPDIDSGTLAYFGISWGGRMGPQVLATEPRFKAAVFYSGGLASGRGLPEVDQINFVTRVTQPVLMLNGLRDSVEPYETAQKPMFDLLGTPLENKRHVTFEDTGHGLQHVPMVRETVDWLDRHLGVAGGNQG